MTIWPSMDRTVLWPRDRHLEGDSTCEWATKSPMPLQCLLAQESKIRSVQLPRALNFHLCLSTENRLVHSPGLSAGSFHQSWFKLKIRNSHSQARTAGPTSWLLPSWRWPMPRVGLSGFGSALPIPTSFLLLVFFNDYFIFSVRWFYESGKDIFLKAVRS